MAIGYMRARNLMRQSDWKLVLITPRTADGTVSYTVYHPLRPNRYKVRRDSGEKLVEECDLEKVIDANTTILHYDRDEK